MNTFCSQVFGEWVMICTLVSEDGHARDSEVISFLKARRFQVSRSSSGVYGSKEVGNIRAYATYLTNSGTYELQVSAI